MTRVVIVDDEALVRQGLRLILELGGVEVVGEAEDGRQGVAAVFEHRPDVVLMDLRMPVLDGVGATRELVAESGARVLVLTTFDVDQQVVAAIRAGAVGFLLKDATSAQLVDAVHRAAAGEQVLAPQVLARMVRHFTVSPPDGARPMPRGMADLSEREVEVLRLIGAGLSNNEIADRLVISMATVKSHVRHIFSKLDLRDRAQAIVTAHDAGLRAD